MVKSDPRKGYGSQKSGGVWPGLIASAADRKPPFVLQHAAFSCYCCVNHVLRTSDADNRGGLSVDTAAAACQATEINWVGDDMANFRRAMHQAGILTKTQESCAISAGCAADGMVWYDTTVPRYLPGNQSIVMTLGPGVLKRARTCSSQKQKNTLGVGCLKKQPEQKINLGNKRERERAETPMNNGYIGSA